MTKKLLLLCAVMVMCVGRISAQNDEPVWHLVTDSRQYIPVEQVSYLLFADGADVFSVVKADSEVIADVRMVSFAKVALAVEAVKDNGFDVSVFPNPVVSELSVQGLREQAQARVLSVDGALLIEAAVAPGNGRIDLSSLPAGMYVLQVNGTSVKFIKK